MKAAMFYGGPDIRVEKLPQPEPGPEEVLVRVRAAGICGSDLHGYRRARLQASQEAGRQSGHELMGTIAALGPGVGGLRIGQRVGIEPEHLVGCGTCRYCRRGDTHLCPTRGQRHGERQGSHGFSEYDVCIARNVHPLPDSVSDDAAAILDCYGCAVHAVRRVPIHPYATVAVIGTGAIGMNVGQVARAGGAARVIMAGTRPEPLAVAREAGAADDGVANSQADPVAAVLDLTGGEGADVVFETVGGNAPTLEQAVKMARRGGTVCVMGIFTTPPSLDERTAYRKELTITWSNSYSTWNGLSEYEIALEMLASGRIRAEPLITHHFPLDRIGDAFAAAADKRSSGAIKVLVHP
ncbi:MAG: alcohol dehydrogenase catalytic domain-containing protein [Chloroflexi bacterium]|nr:alcohol dehydrogenase catalytic domain-containing protein [Chloroflexota bacterium]